MLRPGEIATILERAQISHAIVDARFLDDFDGAAGRHGRARCSPMTATRQRRARAAAATAIAPGFAPVDTAPRRRRPDRLHLGHDRQAQGLRPLSPRHPRPRRQLRPPRAEAAARRPLGLLGADRLHLRARHAADLPLALRRHRGDDRDARARSRCSTRSQRHKVTILATAPTAYKAMLGRCSASTTSPRFAPASRPASICPPRPGRPGSEATGIADRRRHRRDRDDAHLHLRLGRRHPPRRDRQGGARLCRHRARRGGPADGGRHRPARGQGADRLPLFRRRAPGGLCDRAAGTSPATPTARTRTAISGTSPAPTT